MDSTQVRKFEVRIFRAGDGYVVDAADARGRRTRRSFEFPLNEWKVKYLVSEATRASVAVRSGDARAKEAARQLGSELFTTVFAGEVGQWLDSTIDDRSSAVRLQLDLNGAPELAALPWEYLYHPERRFHLATDRNITLVRYSQSPEPAVDIEIAPPLRILGVACSPRDMADISVDAERQQLASSLSELTQAGMVEIDWVSDNSLDAVARRLASKPYHVFHFIGHGTFYEENDRPHGLLMFERQNGQADPVPAEDLAAILRRSVKLAVINACEGARGNTDPAAGIASSLLWQGIPAVIAMQFEISDDAGICFTQDFYTAVAAGDSIDAAVTTARYHMSAKFRNSAEWATPVLFVRTGEGQVLHLINRSAATLQSAQASELLQRFWSDVGRLADQSAMPDWAKGFLSRTSWQRPTGSPEELYQQAAEAMESEDWEAASRLFGLLNNRRPGYRDMATRWREVERQSNLAGHYKRLVDQYRQGNWHKVIEIYGSIYALDTTYLDSAQLYADATQQLQMQRQHPEPARQPSRPKPAILPGSQPPRPKPATLPGSQPKPTSPPGDTASSKSKKPPTLPT